MYLDTAPHLLQQVLGLLLEISVVQQEVIEAVRVLSMQSLSPPLKWSQFNQYVFSLIPAFPCIYLNILRYGSVGFETWDPDSESSALHSATCGESAWTLDHWASHLGWKHHLASSYSELTIPGELKRKQLQELISLLCNWHNALTCMRV